MDAAAQPATSELSAQQLKPLFSVSQLLAPEQPLRCRRCLRLFRRSLSSCILLIVVLLRTVLRMAARVLRPRALQGHLRAAPGGVNPWGLRLGGGDSSRRCEPLGLLVRQDDSPRGCSGGRDSSRRCEPPGGCLGGGRTRASLGASRGSVHLRCLITKTSAPRRCTLLQRHKRCILSATKTQTRAAPPRQEQSQAQRRNRSSATLCGGGFDTHLRLFIPARVSATRRYFHSCLSS